MIVTFAVPLIAYRCRRHHPSGCPQIFLIELKKKLVFSITYSQQLSKLLKHISHISDLLPHRRRQKNHVGPLNPLIQ